MRFLLVQSHQGTLADRSCITRMYLADQQLLPALSDSSYLVMLFILWIVLNSKEKTTTLKANTSSIGYLPSQTFLRNSSTIHGPCHHLVRMLSPISIESHPLWRRELGRGNTLVVWGMGVSMVLGTVLSAWSITVIMISKPETSVTLTNRNRAWIRRTRDTRNVESGGCWIVI